MQVGLIRRIDNLGRITLPKEYRDFFHMEPETEVCIEATTEGLLISCPKYKVVEIKSTDT